MGFMKERGDERESLAGRKCNETVKVTEKHLNRHREVYPQLFYYFFPLLFLNIHSLDGALAPPLSPVFYLIVITKHGKTTHTSFNFNACN